MAIVPGYPWLHLYNLSIDWVTHELTFRPQSANKPPVDTLRSTFSGAHPGPSDPLESLAPPVSPSVLLSAPSTSDELQAAASIQIPS